MKYLINNAIAEAKTPESLELALNVSNTFERILEKTKKQLDMAESFSLDVDDFDRGRHIGLIQGIKKILDILEGRA